MLEEVSRFKVRGDTRDLSNDSSGDVLLEFNQLLHRRTPFTGYFQSYSKTGFIVDGVMHSVKASKIV